MSTLAEIEDAIESLPANEVETLAHWLDLRLQGIRQPATQDKRQAVTTFLQRWTGAGTQGMTNDELDANRTARLMAKHVK